MQNQNDVLTNELATFQKQVQVMKRELDLYHSLLDNAVKTGAGVQTTGKPGLNLTGKKVLELLEEIRALREQLEGSIRTNQAMRERLRTSLEQTASSMSYQHSPPTASRGTQASFSERGSHLGRVTSEGDRGRVTGEGDRGGRLSPAASLHSSHAGAQVHSSPHSSRHQAAGTTFSHPRETSTPHGELREERSHSVHAESHLKTTRQHHHHQRVRSDGHAVTTTVGAPASHEAGGGLYSGAGVTTTQQVGLHSRPELHRLHTLLTQTHDMESMETKVQQVLDLPDLQVNEIYLWDEVT